eukprot:TRINITY_DN6770_c0_g1_i2.p1 TRINITY_DN6770_c0_g1~~TRINITY_DN6770_c0_g1_i2.p1  ORF type:complete len:355 (+),score=79.02 TRINITY_DN6770_c0_g1_i2:101-1165(+)
MSGLHAHYDPSGSVSRSRSWAGKSGGGRSASPAGSFTGSCVSRLESNQGMREKAAELWLDQLRRTHDKRRSAMQRTQEIQERQKNIAQTKIDEDNMKFSKNRNSHNEYLRSRSHAFQDRQNYLRDARDHSQSLQMLKEEQIEQEVSYKMSRAEESHQRAVSSRARNTFHRNKERSDNVKRNNSLLSKRRESIGKAKLSVADMKQRKIMDQKRKEEEERLAIAEEREMMRRTALSRADMIAEHKKAATEAKINYDGCRSSSVLRKREEWLKQKQQASASRQSRIHSQVAHASMVRAAKEQQYDQHFKESVAIGKETAEHNKIFKLNNKIMHEVMQGMIHDSKSHRSRSSSTYRRS